MSTATQLLSAIETVGRDARRGGYSRHGFDRAELELREWFVAEAERRELAVRCDRNGNLWAWWGSPGPGAVVRYLPCRYNVSPYTRRGLERRRDAGRRMVKDRRREEIDVPVERRFGPDRRMETRRSGDDRRRSPPRAY